MQSHITWYEVLGSKHKWFLSSNFHSIIIIFLTSKLIGSIHSSIQAQRAVMYVTWYTNTAFKVH